MTETIRPPVKVWGFWSQINPEMLTGVALSEPTGQERGEAAWVVSEEYMRIMRETIFHSLVKRTTLIPLADVTGFHVGSVVNVGDPPVTYRVIDVDEKNCQIRIRKLNWFLDLRFLLTAWLDRIITRLEDWLDDDDDPEFE